MLRRLGSPDVARELFCEAAPCPILRRSFRLDLELQFGHHQGFSCIPLQVVHMQLR